jgi:signal transduction histidine kinase
VRSLAVKIFLSFWIMHALILVVLALLPDQGARARLAEIARRDGRIATTLLEQHGRQSCDDYLSVTQQRADVQIAILDARGAVACAPSSAIDLSPFGAHLAQRDGDVVEASDARELAVVSVDGPSGAPYTVTSIATGAAQGPQRPVRQRPLPRDVLITTLLVSGVVCFVVARYLAHPLQQLRRATYRLAAGDLGTRVGATLAVRSDETGDLVRDFDAMAERIETLVQSQTQLLSDISHELRSPLARLNVALELARRKAPDEARAELDRIEAEAARMNDMVGSLLELSRVEGDRRARKVATVDLNDVVQHVVEDADYEARRVGKSVTLRSKGRALVDGDANLIARAVENVVRNAIRYAPEGTAIEVHVTGEARQARIGIADQGPGVPEADLERIFAPFHRVGASRTRESGGVGLGLSIARRAIALHNGTITAANAPARGLIVTILLPASAVFPASPTT